MCGMGYTAIFLGESKLQIRASRIEMPQTQSGGQTT